MRILICFEDDGTRRAVEAALATAGQSVVAGADPEELAPQAPSAVALLVEAPQARRAIALLRDRGFTGRALVAGPPPAEEEPGAAGASADGHLALEPLDDLAPRLARAVGGRRRILAVVSSEGDARKVRSELEEAGFEVALSPGAEEAARQLARRAAWPDLVLAEAGPAGGALGGAELCRFLKDNERFRPLKVALLADGTEDELLALARECGADVAISRSGLIG